MESLQQIRTAQQRSYTYMFFYWWTQRKWCQTRWLAQSLTGFALCSCCQRANRSKYLNMVFMNSFISSGPPGPEHGWVLADHLVYYIHLLPPPVTHFWNHWFKWKPAGPPIMRSRIKNHLTDSRLVSSEEYLLKKHTSRLQFKVDLHNIVIKAAWKLVITPYH